MKIAMKNEEIKKMCWQINVENNILDAVLPWVVIGLFVL